MAGAASIREVVRAPRPRHGVHLLRLETFRANWIELRCCQGIQYPPVRLVLAADPRRGARTLADFLIRLRCQACGARPASAVLVDSVAGPAAARAGYGAPAAGPLALLPE